MKVARTCVVCGTVFHVQPSAVAKRPARACSLRCAGVYRRSHFVTPAGSLSHMWKGDAASPVTGRKRAQKLYSLGDCQTCGATREQAKILRHHVDLNSLNNEPSNIQILCASCHNRLHAALITHCPSGHAYDAANTRIGANRKRQCRACYRDRQKAAYHAKRRADFDSDERTAVAS